MKVRLFHRLLIAFVGVAVASLATAALLWQWQIGAGFLDYVNRTERSDVERVGSILAGRFAEQGDWRFLRGGPGRPSREWEETWRVVRGHAPPPAPPAPPRFAPAGRGRPGEPRPPRAAPEPTPADDPARTAGSSPLETRVALHAPNDRRLAGPRLRASGWEATPIQVEGATVGEIRRVPLKDIPAGLEADFLRQQAHAVLLSMAGVQLLAILAAWLLARQLARPVRRLASGTRVLTSGDYDHRLVLDRSDELGDLSRDLDQLARRLASAQRARREWMADIAHELRTPLTVLRGEIEAMVDGVRETSPERLRSLASEVLCLGRLIDDLHLLALSDAGALDYRMGPVPLSPLVEDAVSAFRRDARDGGLTMQLVAADGDPRVTGDADRLLQLLNNLLSNALRYTDPGGRIEVHLGSRHGRVVLTIDDSAPGLSAQERERLGTPLFRPDAARSRSHGGSGLGLAIAIRIAEAHGGRLGFAASDLGGLRVTVDLPEQP